MHCKKREKIEKNRDMPVEISTYSNGLRNYTIPFERINIPTGSAIDEDRITRALCVWARPAECQQAAPMKSMAPKQ